MEYGRWYRCRRGFTMAIAGAFLFRVLPDNLPAAEADEGQMNQVVLNIVKNAEEAMPQGGIIRIGAGKKVVGRRGSLPLIAGNYIEITIKDQGTGISEEYLHRIFEPYFTTKQKGSGLGLATTYSIIKNHGGYITVRSELGNGTTFYIYLPASKKRLPTGGRQGAKVPYPGGGEYW